MIGKKLPRIKGFCEDCCYYREEMYDDELRGYGKCLHPMMFDDESGYNYLNVDNDDYCSYFEQEDE